MGEKCEFCGMPKPHNFPMALCSNIEALRARTEALMGVLGEGIVQVEATLITTPVGVARQRLVEWSNMAQAALSVSSGGGGGQDVTSKGDAEVPASNYSPATKESKVSPAPANPGPTEKDARPDERAMIDLPDGGLLLTSPHSLPKPSAPEECDLCDGEGKYLDAFHMHWILCGKCGGTVETKAAAAAYAAAEKASTSPTNPAQLDEATVAAVEKRASLISDALTRQELLAFLNEVRTMQADNRSMRAELLEMTKMLARIVEAHAGARSGDEREAILEAAVWFRKRGGTGQDENGDGGEKL